MIIYQGTYTPMLVFLDQYDFTGVQKVVMTIKNSLDGSPLITREFTSPDIYEVMITPTEAASLNYESFNNSGTAYVDFDKITTAGAQRIKISSTERIKVKRGVGNVSDT